MTVPISEEVRKAFVEFGKMTAKKRFKGMTKEEISKHMSWVRRMGIKREKK